MTAVVDDLSLVLADEEALAVTASRHPLVQVLWLRDEEVRVFPPLTDLPDDLEDPGRYDRLVLAGEELTAVGDEACVERVVEHLRDPRPGFERAALALQPKLAADLGQLVEGIGTGRVALEELQDARGALRVRDLPAAFALRRFWRRVQVPEGGVSRPVSLSHPSEVALQDLAPEVPDEVNRNRGEHVHGETAARVGTVETFGREGDVVPGVHEFRDRHPIPEVPTRPVNFVEHDAVGVALTESLHEVDETRSTCLGCGLDVFDDVFDDKATTGAELLDDAALLKERGAMHLVVGGNPDVAEHG